MHKKHLNFLCKYINDNKIKLILTNVPISKNIKNLVKEKKNENDTRHKDIKILRREINKIIKIQPKINISIGMRLPPKRAANKWRVTKNINNILLYFFLFKTSKI